METPENMSLAERVRQVILEKYKGEGLVNFHVSLGPKAHKMTYEELLAYQIEILEQGKAQRAEWNSLPETEKLKWNIRHLIEALRNVMDVAGESNSDWAKRIIAVNATAEEQKLRKRLGDIWCDVDMALVTVRDTETFKQR